MAESWTLRGSVLISCNCDWGCPCNFNARPTTGRCEGGWTWHVDRGHFGGVALDGLNFSVFVKWPGAIHEGNGEALLLVDERAGDGLAEAEVEKGGQSGIFLVAKRTGASNVRIDPTLVLLDAQIGSSRLRWRAAACRGEIRHPAWSGLSMN